MDNLLENVSGLELDSLAFSLEELILKKQKFFNSGTNKLISDFKLYYGGLPGLKSDFIDLDSKEVGCFLTNELSLNKKSTLEKSLKNFIPWRKGPFNIFGVQIDSEWNSFLKWKRFEDKIDFNNKILLDIGSSNGYYLFKAAGKNIKFGLGIEPFIPYYYQFQAVNKYIGLKNISTLPIAFNELPQMENFYDLVFLMGVLYHRKSPIDMLLKIRQIMKKDGEIVLENLIILSEEPIALTPEKRYAEMNNVYFVPSIKTLEIWLKKAGFYDIECLDVTRTDFNEQRSTGWSFEKSLKDFLDPLDKNKTKEGYPAPVRAVIKAKAK
ncbi:MAG: tRNA 5-methoxyuridine(34)/uridine 5-oxyacetic acid(34) synthase CmoB [Desulfobacteraceae bacterium]|nr:tRNA 5-methoxyuridine(34)/uridine 5-oxyacetic acid(34) synthase CmoB [Desulfobacteraceae bacterium]